MATQAERRSSTQARVLDAATACLVEGGVSEFTTTAVASRAGLSQGALFRYFPTKQDLLAAAGERLFAELRALYEERFAIVSGIGPVSVPTALRLLAELVEDPRYLATLELHTAARTDPSLRRRLDPVVHAHSQRLHELGYGLTVDLPRKDRQLVVDLVDVATLALQGAALHGLAVHQTDAIRRAVAAMIRFAGAGAGDDATTGNEARRRRELPPRPSRRSRNARSRKDSR
jgi:AcrR family transcriptional regulator